MGGCDRISTDLKAYADGEVTVFARWRIGRHLAACPACRAHLRVLRNIGELVRAADNATPPVSLRERILAGLPDPAPRAYDASRRPISAYLPPPASRRRPTWALAGASAAACLLALAVWTRVPLVGPEGDAAREPAHAPAATLDADVPAASQQAPSNLRDAARDAHNAAVANQGASEIVGRPRQQLAAPRSTPGRAPGRVARREGQPAAEMADHAAAPQPVPAPIFRATLGQATGEGAAQEVAQPGAPQAGLGGALGDAPTPLGRPEGSGMAAGGLGGGGMAGGLTGAPSDEVARTRLVVHTDRPEAAAATLMKLAAERGWVLHPAPDDPREGSPQVARVMLTVPADQVHVFTRELARAAPGVAGAHLPPSLAAPGATGAVPSHRGAGTPSAQPGAGEKALSDETHRERAAEDYTVRAIDRNTQMGQAPGGGQRLDRPVGEPSQRQVDAARTAALRVYVVEFRAATPPAGAGRRPTSQQRARPAR